MNLIELFQPSFRGRSDKPAIDFGGKALTFGELDRLSDAAAVALRDRFGVCQGDRLSMYLGNCHELVIWYLAGLKLGAIIVPMNLLYRDHELNHLIGDAEPKLLLTDRERYEVLRPLRDGFPCLQQVFLADDNAGDQTLAFSELTATPAPAPISVAPVTGDTPALMVYTSGTTGRSKGALLTHDNLGSNIIALLHCWQWTENDRFLLALPLFHVHGLCNGLHGALASGCTTFLLPRFKADVVTETLNHEQCTLFFGVPTMYERLLEAADGGAEIPACMRLYVSGSAPLSPDTFKRFKAIYGHEILERYGMSETAMITSNLYAGGRIQGTVGRPLPGVRLRIADKAGQPVADGDAGEIQIKGPNVLKEYWRQPEKTAESFQDGWFKTSDLGRFDEHGHVIICGRRKELIISGGFNIYPQEVINCLVEHPAVSEAAVIGVPDQRRGELVKAYIVTVAGHSVDAQELTDYCKEHLASFKVPKSVVFIDALPRNAMGKIQLQNLPNRDRL
ncbi:MAG: AMP-binding protein [Pirellulaceae bacterium]|nr:AMP-binding protein [Pirellulaceae bacterium]